MPSIKYIDSVFERQDKGSAYLQYLYREEIAGRTVKSVGFKIFIIFITPCKKQPSICELKICTECCELRENENWMQILLASDLTFHTVA
jgi:hypothetical protein